MLKMVSFHFVVYLTWYMVIEFDRSSKKIIVFNIDVKQI